MSSSSTTTSASISVRAPAVYSVDDAGVEHEAPERHESEFARALEADFKRRALAAAAEEEDEEEEPANDDNNNNDESAIGEDGAKKPSARGKSTSGGDADATEKQWFEIYQNLTNARGEIEQAHFLIETLAARRFLQAQQLPTLPPAADALAQQRRIAVQAKREQLTSAATKIFVHCESLRSQLAADRVYFGQLRQLCQRWRLVLADNGTLMFDYVPLLTAARDLSTALERAVCVRVQHGNVALRLPAMRALALGRRIGVYCGARRIALVQGPIGVPPRRAAAAEPHGVEHCDDLLVRARQSVWLERMFLQLVRETSAFPTDVAFLAEDRRESEHRAVCIVLRFADDAKPLTLSFELEPGVEGDTEADGAATTSSNARKRRFDDATAANDDDNDATAANDSAVVALASILDTTLSRLCHGVQRQHCRQLARWHPESSTTSAASAAAAAAAAEDEDTRVAQWLASDDESDTAPKAPPVAFAAGGRRLRAKFATYFANDEDAGDDVPVSLVKAVRLLYAQCRSEAVVRGALARLQELVFGDALQCEWQSGASPFESKCIVRLQGAVLDTLELIDGKLQAQSVSVPRTLVGTVQKIRFVLHSNASAFERWLQERSAAEKQQLASRIGTASLDAILAVVDIR